MRHTRSSSYVGSLLVFAALAGCATTGDPSQGGFFFWSQRKADERQAAFEQQAEANRQAAEAERERSMLLYEQKNAVSTDVSQLRADLARESERSKDLEKQLRALMQERRLDQAEVARLNDKLHENERKMRAWRNGTTAVSSASLDDARQRNNALRKEILRLAGE